MESTTKGVPQVSSGNPGRPYQRDCEAGRTGFEASGGVQDMPRSEFFWKRHPGLVWSNRHATDDVRIRAALMKPNFPVLLDIAAEFGPDRLEKEWGILRADPETDTRRVEQVVSQILANIRRGYEQTRA
jgi:hypothetical protein